MTSAEKKLDGLTISDLSSFQIHHYKYFKSPGKKTAKIFCSAKTLNILAKIGNDFAYKSFDNIVSRKL